MPRRRCTRSWARSTRPWSTRAGTSTRAGSRRRSTAGAPRGGAVAAVQEAVRAAAVRWPADGVPASPLGWLITVASRRLTDLLRSDEARARREVAVGREVPVPGDPPPDEDDTLVLLFMCCHPSL